MKELEFTLQSSLEANYLNIRLPAPAALDEIAIRVIQEDCPDFLIPFRMVDVNGSISLKYQLMNTVAFSYYDKALSKGEFIDLYLNLMAPFIQGKDWFLDYHNLCIDMHYVFVNKMSGKAYFIYVPELSCQNSDEEILQFFRDAFFNCHLEGDSEFQIYLYRMFARKDVTLAELYQTFIEERQKLAGRSGQGAAGTSQAVPGQAASGSTAAGEAAFTAEAGRAAAFVEAGRATNSPEAGRAATAPVAPARTGQLSYGQAESAAYSGTMPVADACGQAVRSEMAARGSADGQESKSARKGFLGNLLGGEKGKRKENGFEEIPPAVTGDSLGASGDGGVIDEIFGKKEKKKDTKKKKETGSGLDFLGHKKKKESKAAEGNPVGLGALTGIFAKGPETGARDAEPALPGTRPIGGTAAAGQATAVFGGAAVVSNGMAAVPGAAAAASGGMSDITVDNEMTEDRTEIAEDWEADPAAYLQLIDSPIPGAPAKIGLDFDKPYITIGRVSSDETQPDVAFGREFSRIGRQHARIEKRDGRYYVIDLGSLNHTLLNGQALIPNQPYELKSGEELAFTASKPVRYRICL